MTDVISGVWDAAAGFVDRVASLDYGQLVTNVQAALQFGADRTRLTAALGDARASLAGVGSWNVLGRWRGQNQVDDLTDQLVDAIGQQSAARSNVTQMVASLFDGGPVQTAGYAGYEYASVVGTGVSTLAHRAFIDPIQAVVEEGLQDYGNFRAAGYSLGGAASATLSAGLGGVIGLGGLSDASEGRDKLGGQLTSGERFLRGGFGAVQLVTSATGLFAAGKLGGQALAKQLRAPRGAVPHGFVTTDEFSNFGSALSQKMQGAGYDDVQAILQGSGVTGVRARSKVGIPAGTPFDAIKASDFDVALVSEKLFAKAIELGIPLRGGKTRTGPLWPGNLRAMGIGDLPDDLLKSLYQHENRKINFMIYETLEEALKRPSIRIPGK